MGYKLIQRIEGLKKAVDALGLKMATPKHFYDQGTDYLALIPKDADSLPVYSRDAEVFTGSLDALETWLLGVDWARRYDTLVFGRKHNSNRERKEQLCRNGKLVKLLQQSEPKFE